MPYPKYETISKIFYTKSNTFSEPCKFMYKYIILFHKGLLFSFINTFWCRYHKQDRANYWEFRNRWKFLQKLCFSCKRHQGIRDNADYTKQSQKQRHFTLQYCL